MLTGLRKTLRRWVPMRLRHGVARLHRASRDRLDGSHGRLTRRRAPPWEGTAIVTIEQSIKQSPLWEGKLANLQRGAAVLDGVLVAPGELFSFWHWIGQPTSARGFAVGRAIRDDLATGDPGGGLCQLSGIVYELGLRGGLTVVERHAHSRDLYATEEERFTPLGLDATVVCPWKDLRLENPLDVPVVLRLAVEGMVLRAWLQADGAVEPQALVLERSDHADHRRVTVRRSGVLVSTDRYAI
jgi:vancomycin resistance protein VanW